ncbi:MAG: hypothetical protein ACOC5F_04075 [Candidatus Aminicenantaceae bacterium]
MEVQQEIDYQKQIEEASKKAKTKKVLYLYDELGYKRLLGIFSKKSAEEIKKQLRKQKIIDRMTEIEIKTTQPESSYY